MLLITALLMYPILKCYATSIIWALLINVLSLPCWMGIYWMNKNSVGLLEVRKIDFNWLVYRPLRMWFMQQNLILWYCLSAWKQKLWRRGHENMTTSIYYDNACFHALYTIICYCFGEKYWSKYRRNTHNLDT